MITVIHNKFNYSMLPESFMLDASGIWFISAVLVIGVARVLYNLVCESNV